MLIAGICFYMLSIVVVGVWAARRVKNNEDFLVAGRQLPLHITAAALFATWFGAETVMGAGSQMATEGLRGVIEDPFGASLCLLLIGVFFARPLYQMKLLTFGDFYLVKYGKTTEWLASIMLVFSYFGWIAAQMIALGVLANLVLGMDMTTGIILGSLIVVFYTFFGGMWSVSVLDFVQNIIIIVGLGATVMIILPGVFTPKFTSNLPKDYFQFLPPAKPLSIFNWVAAWLTIGLGSLAQQDVFQRIMSAKNEQTAVRAGYIGFVLYLTVGLMPLVLGAYIRAFYPQYLAGDAQFALPKLILLHTPVWVQLLFFGALISAVMSTASGAILAPASILSENIILHLFPKWGHKNMLLTSRISVLIISTVSLILALSGGNIYELVGQSSALSLVSLFVPMVAALYFKKVEETSAVLSIVFGLVAWLLALHLQTEADAGLIGLLFSITGFGLGKLLQKR